MNRLQEMIRDYTKCKDLKAKLRYRIYRNGWKETFEEIDDEMAFDREKVRFMFQYKSTPDNIVRYHEPVLMAIERDLKYPFNSISRTTNTKTHQCWYIPASNRTITINLQKLTIKIHSNGINSVLECTPSIVKEILQNLKDHHSDYQR